MLIKKLISGLLISILFFQCSNNNQASESEKNWCYGQYTKFINSYEIGWRNGYVFDIYESDETIDFARQFISYDSSARTLFKDRYGEIDEFELRELFEQRVDSYDLDLNLEDSTTSYVLVIQVTRDRLLKEAEGSLELCKIFYEVSTLN